jgi:hypothetical protein
VCVAIRSIPTKYHTTATQTNAHSISWPLARFGMVQGDGWLTSSYWQPDPRSQPWFYAQDRHVFHCSNCDRALAGTSNVLPNAHDRSTKCILPDCTYGGRFFVEPIAWMVHYHANELSKQAKGVLYCPQCREPVGRWIWDTQRCFKCKTSGPGFLLESDRLVKQAGACSTSIAGSSDDSDE